MEINTDDSMVTRFYSANNNFPFWVSSKKNIKKATEWLAVIDSSKNFGMAVNHLQINQIRVALINIKAASEKIKAQTDQQITALVLNFLKEFQEGNIHFDYDEVYANRDSVYIQQLLKSKSQVYVSKMVDRLECKDEEYRVLKNFMNDSITSQDTLKFKSVIRAINYRKYLTVNHQPEFILVNIPETMVRYYRNDLLTLEMRAVVGRKKFQTPTIASHIINIVTFPYWNVPHSIAVKEILPKVKKDEAYLEQNNYEVVDSKGVEIDDANLIWENYTEKNFPYFFRQSTGTENALGVLKFNLQNPFSIFLHSTSLQSGFKKDFRFLSHGCIRLENPIELANDLLRGKLDMIELKEGKENTKSGKIALPDKIQVFLIYSTAIVVDKKVTFLPDVYGLIN